MKHDISYYSDGNLKVEFCRVCGLENSELNFECIGKFIDKNDKKVDKDKELK